MPSKILISLGVVFYLIVIPYLEINDSHVFNSSWPAHARFHEVWQLTTHGMLGLVALWYTWLRGEIRIAAIISCCVMSGVVVAHLTSGNYGGSVQSGNLGTTVLGLDLAVFVALCVIITAIAAVILNRKKVSE